MIPTSLARVAEVTGGRLQADPDRTVDGPVSVDSRQVRPGGLFVALPGAHVDGHDFVPAALAAGALAALVTRPVPGPHILVDDATAALGRLARDVVDRAPALTTVAVTGSSGKTTTKDLLAVTAPRIGPTVAAAGSFNNEIGAPLTALRVAPDTRVLVMEMGARGVGHIRYLCQLTPPTIGVVLNVGSAHLGEFGSREAIAAAKGELVEALPPDGLAVLNVDDPLVAAMRPRTAARVVGFGEHPGADVRAVDVRLDPQGRPAFRLVTPAGEAPVRLRLYGEHHVTNALATAAVLGELGLAPDAVATALEGASPASRWRMEVHTRPDGVTVINDAYNANPESMRAALKALASMAGGRRTWAVLGQMLELGADEVAEHDAIGRLAVRLNISRLVAVGEGARPLYLGAALEGSWSNEATWVPDADAATALLAAELAPGDLVLVKASRAVSLERVAEALLGQAGGDATS